MSRSCHTLVLATLLVVWLVSPSFAAQERGEPYKEAVLGFYAFQKKLQILRLDGTVERYELPMPLGRHIPEGGIDVSVWGKVVYVGRYSKRPRLEGRPKASLDDGRAPVYYAGFWSNQLEELDPEQLAVSPDGSKLAFVAAPKVRARRERAALFCMSLLTGKLVQVTSFKDVAARPKWSNRAEAVAFYLGTQRHLSADENEMGIYVVQTPLGEEPRVKQVAPPVQPSGLASAKQPPAWADNDTVIYFEGRYGEEVHGYAPKFVYRIKLGTMAPEKLAVGSRPVSDSAGRVVIFSGLPFGKGTYIVKDHEGPAKLFLPGKLEGRAISPSGRYLIAYCDDEERGPHLRIFRTEDATAVLVTETLGGHPRWIRIWKRTPRLFEDEK